MTIQVGKELDAFLYLQAQKIYPAKKYGHQSWYYSPFRQERTFSFKVDRPFNLWFDFGENKLGMPIDLGIRLKNCCVKDCLVSLHDSHQRGEAFSFLQPLPAIQLPGTYTVSSNLLADYLHKRNISTDIADKYLCELRYQNRGKICFALGFKNGLGGYELRSFFFKGSTSPKCGTSININAAFISVFEGFFDFRSYLSCRRPKGSSYANYLVLNTLAFFEKQLTFLQQFVTVHWFRIMTRPATKQWVSPFHWMITSLSIKESYSPALKIVMNGGPGMQSLLFGRKFLTHFLYSGLFKAVPGNLGWGNLRPRSRQDVPLFHTGILLLPSEVSRSPFRT